MQTLKGDVMLTHRERQQLMRDFRDEPGYRPGVVVKCAVGLLITAVLALVGTAAGVRSDAVPAPVAAESTHYQSRTAEARSTVEASWSRAEETPATAQPNATR